MKLKKHYKLVILDRDGVINEDSEEYIKSAAEWHAIPDSLEAIAKLNRAGIKVVIASNQSGIARGFFTEQVLAKIHQKMQAELTKLGGHIDDIFYCPHHPDDNCACRKPKPKMLLDILRKYKIDKKDVLVVGDKLADVQAAQKIGCDVALVKTGNGQQTLANYRNELQNVLVSENLSALVSMQIIN
jgi:D-glycero-D-manno-heptose 1,7-bisphosphate phosphatase